VKAERLMSGTKATASSLKGHVPMTMPPLINIVTYDHGRKTCDSGRIRTPPGEILDLGGFYRVPAGGEEEGGAGRKTSAAELRQ